MTKNNHKTNAVEELNSLPPNLNAFRIEDDQLQEMIELLAFDEDLFNQDCAPMTDEFRRKCIETADAAWELAKLQAEHERLGIRPQPLVDYLQQLANTVNLSLAAVAARFGIAELSHPTADNVRPWSRLSREVGLSLEETIQLMRIGFAEMTGMTQMAMPMLRSPGAHSRKPPADCEPELRRIESNYNTQEWREFERLKAEIRAVFAAPDGESTAR